MSQTDYTIPRTLSRHQYGTLKFLHENKVTMSYLRVAHANTLGSLAYRGYLYITHDGVGDKAVVGLTKTGLEALKVYQDASLSERQHEADLSDRCQRLLKHARRNVVPLQRTA